MFSLVIWLTEKNGFSEILQLSPNSEDQKADFYKIVLQRELYKQEQAEKLKFYQDKWKVLYLGQIRSM